MHIYAYIYVYVCIRMHIYAYVVHIYAYVCIIAHPCTFMNVYTVYTYLYICVHNYAYPCIFTHIYSQEDVDILSMKNMQQGYSSMAVEIPANTLNISLACIITGTINIHSDAVPELPHGTVAGSAVCAFRYIEQASLSTAAPVFRTIKA